MNNLRKDQAFLRNTVTDTRCAQSNLTPPNPIINSRSKPNSTYNHFSQRMTRIYSQNRKRMENKKQPRNINSGSVDTDRQNLERDQLFKINIERIKQSNIKLQNDQQKFQPDNKILCKNQDYNTISQLVKTEQPFSKGYLEIMQKKTNVIGNPQKLNQGFVQKRTDDQIDIKFENKVLNSHSKSASRNNRKNVKKQIKISIKRTKKKIISHRPTQSNQILKINQPLNQNIQNLKSSIENILKNTPISKEYQCQVKSTIVKTKHRTTSNISTKNKHNLNRANSPPSINNKINVRNCFIFFVL